jgi:hypothetical protein
MPGIAISRREGDDRSSAGADQGVQHHLLAPFEVAMIPSRIDENIYIGLRQHQLGQLFAEGHMMDLERRGQDGINGGMRNGRRIRAWYAAAQLEGDEEESNQARSER